MSWMAAFYLGSGGGTITKVVAAMPAVTIEPLPLVFVELPDDEIVVPGDEIEIDDDLIIVTDDDEITVE